MLATTANSAGLEIEEMIERIADAVHRRIAVATSDADPPDGDRSVPDADANAAEEDNPEGRREHRRRVLMGGKVTGGRRHASIDCMIRNLSSGGACIQFDGLHNVPDTFQLYVQRDGLVRDARLVWRKATQAGIAFSGWEQKIAGTDFSNRDSIIDLVRSVGVAEM